MIKFKVADWGKAEYFSAINYMCSFGLLCSDRYVGKLQHELSEQTNADKVFLLNSARAGIVLSLKWARDKAPNKTEVLVPSYICPSVIDTIKSLGLKPVLIDVDKELLIVPEKVRTKLSGRSLAVVVAHMYGAIANTRLITEYAHRFGAIVIDDAAQRSGTQEGNDFVGHDGDIGIVSFAQAKTIVTGVKASGGALFSHNKAFSEYCKKHYLLLPKSRSRWYPMLHFSLSYLLGGCFKRIDYYIQRVLFKFNWLADFYEVAHISPIDAQIAFAQYRSLASRINTSYEILKIYRQGFTQLTIFDALQLRDNTTYLSRFIIQTSVIPPKELADKLYKRGIESKFCYLNSSRKYDGSASSGLLELPLTGITQLQACRVLEVLQELNDSAV
ncbi:DegT/DnrJ/EryC1/StrS family aminotransferase [Thalassotalea ganghwensis]